MNVAEIEKAVIDLPLEEKKVLAHWLIEQLEDEADEMAAKEAILEGGTPIAWEQLRSEVGLA